MKNLNNNHDLFSNNENMPADYMKIMDQKDTREFMREQYEMFKLQRKEYKKNTWLLIGSIIISLLSLFVAIIK